MFYRYIYLHKKTGKRIMTNHKMDENEFELVREIANTSMQANEIITK